MGMLTQQKRKIRIQNLFCKCAKNCLFVKLGNGTVDRARLSCGIFFCLLIKRRAEMYELSGRESSYEIYEQPEPVSNRKSILGSGSNWWCCQEGKFIPDFLKLGKFKCS